MGETMAHPRLMFRAQICMFTGFRKGDDRILERCDPAGDDVLGHRHMWRSIRGPSAVWGSDEQSTAVEPLAERLW